MPLPNAAAGLRQGVPLRHSRTIGAEATSCVPHKHRSCSKAVGRAQTTVDQLACSLGCAGLGHRSVALSCSSWLVKRHAGAAPRPTGRLARPPTQACCPQPPCAAGRPCQCPRQLQGLLARSGGRTGTPLRRAAVLTFAAMSLGHQKVVGKLLLNASLLLVTVFNSVGIAGRSHELSTCC